MAGKQADGSLVGHALATGHATARQVVDD